MLENIDWMMVRMILIPFVGAFIGWITNWVAIKMLFHPRKPVKVLFITFHGIFPKNKGRIAIKLGNVVQRDLINFTDIKDRLKDPDTLINFEEEIAFRVDTAIRERIKKSGFAGLVPEQVIQLVHKTIVIEIHKNLPNMIENSMTNLEKKLNISDIVMKKVENFSDERLENLLLDITAREFKFIEVIGAVLGFMIGVIQLLLSGISF
jgi:uncharacterized membrane protein YheB (UPF0754 family)